MFNRFKKDEESFMRLTKIKMKLNIDKTQEFSWQKASMMQGALMEWLDNAYVEKLHKSGLNPYAQYLEKIQEDWYWNIHIFQEEAYTHIYSTVMNPLKNEINLRHGEIKIKIVNKEVLQTDTRELMNEFYFQDSPRTLKIRFKTPTAFKKNGQYLFYPDISCIFKSMMSKYDAVTSEEGKIDLQMLEELLKNTRVLQYRLHSCNFHLEGIKIPAFLGEIKLGFRGSQTLVNYIHFLFHFSEYSGIGIKTAMGMGAIEIEKGR